jgi:cytochrome c oxidase subunit III
MAAEIKIVEEAKAQVGMNPKKFALWLFMVSVVMVFGAFTSAYIVRQAEGNWLDFELPPMFTVTTIIIAVSSITLQWGYWAAKRNNLEVVKVAMTITAILGVAFLVGQWLGWGELVDNGIHFVGRDGAGVSGSFLFVLSGVHGAHVVSGVIVLLVTLLSVFGNKVNSKNLSAFEMCVTYWHFLGILWLYLFVFLLLNR